MSMTPSTTLGTLRPDLAASFEEFNLAEARRGFIGGQVLRYTPVAKASGKFGVIPIEELLKRSATERAPGTAYGRNTRRFTDQSFATQEHGHEEPVDHREAALYSEYFDAEMIAAEAALDVIFRNHEQRVANAVLNTTTWTGAALATNQGTANRKWTRANAATATPVSDVEGAVQKIRENSGLTPNCIILPWKRYRDLRFNEEVLDRIASQGAGDSIKAGDITVAQLSAVFDLPYVLVGDGVVNSADEGQAASLSEIWNADRVMVCRIATSDNFREPCIGRTFHWSEDGSQIPALMESYIEEQTRSTIIRARHDVSEHIIYPQAGHLLTGLAA